MFFKYGKILYIMTVFLGVNIPLYQLEVPDRKTGIYRVVKKSLCT